MTQAVESAREQMEQGTMSAQDAAEVLRTVRTEDADGYIWRVDVNPRSGALSMYRRTGGSEEEGPLDYASEFALSPRAPD